MVIRIIVLLWHYQYFNSFDSLEGEFYRDPLLSLKLIFLLKDGTTADGRDIVEPIFMLLLM